MDSLNCTNTTIETEISRNSDEAQSSAQIVVSIDDLLINILLRLPMKPLTLFKSVSKHWQSLISDPGFRILRNPIPSPAVGLLLHYGESRVDPRIEYVPFSGISSINPPIRKLNFVNEPQNIKIVQSCNGLLLCSTFHDSNVEFTYVYNPTTNKFSALPKIYPIINRASRGMRMLDVCLAFDPAKSPHYKVFIFWSNGSRMQLEVHSSESGGWTKFDEPFFDELISRRCSGVYWNGAIHWKAWKCFYLKLDDDEKPKVIREMPRLPELYGLGRIIDCYWESCGHLHYAVETFGPPILVHVFEMRRDYSEWFLKYCVDLSNVVAAYPSEFRTYEYDARSILSLVRGAKDEDSFLVMQIPGRFIRYNIVRKTFETIREFDECEGSSVFKHENVFHYIESLCCV